MGDSNYILLRTAITVAQKVNVIFLCDIAVSENDVSFYPSMIGMVRHCPLRLGGQWVDSWSLYALQFGDSIFTCRVYWYQYCFNSASK